MDYTRFTEATSRAELLGRDVDLTLPALVAGNVADLTHPSVSATCASLRTYTASEYRPDGSVKRMTLWVSRDGRNRAELLGSAASDSRQPDTVQASGPALRGEKTTHRTHSGFARVHHHRPRVPWGERFATGACCVVAVYGVSLVFSVLTHEQAFWTSFLLTFVGAAMLVHGIELVAPRVKGWIAARVRAAR